MSNSLSYILKQIASICLAKKVYIAVAESCTGGLLAASLTKNAGSSKWFACGVVTYSNQSKIKLLGVNERKIFDNGAVSEEVAFEMATSKALKQHKVSTLSIAITGIAGPTGGSVVKPVGTVCFACVADNYCKVETKLFSDIGNSRSKIRRAAVLHALDMLLQALQCI